MNSLLYNLDYQPLLLLFLIVVEIVIPRGCIVFFKIKDPPKNKEDELWTFVVFWDILWTVKPV